MSKLRILLLTAGIAACLVSSCAEDLVAPSDLLPHSQMVPVMTDLEIAYAGVEQTVKDPKEKVQRYHEMNSMVLKKHGLTHEQFYNSYQWYENDPQQLDTIFKQVVMALNQELADLRKTEASRPRPKEPEIK